VLVVTALVEEITRLEAQIVGGISTPKELRLANGIPSLDGCPPSWLDRYVAELRRLAAPAPVVVVAETALERRSREMDEWWREQSQRKPKRFQVWRIASGGRRCVRLLGATDSQAEACKLCRADPPAVVLDQELGALAKPVLKVSGKKTTTESGPLAAPAPPPKAFVELLERVKALAAAPDGTHVRTLRLSADRARELAAFLRAGLVEWNVSTRGRVRGRRHGVDKVAITIELEKGRAVVRRETPEPVVDTPKKTRRKK
jgi:hypothetical protein